MRRCSLSSPRFPHRSLIFTPESTASETDSLRVFPRGDDARAATWGSVTSPPRKRRRPQVQNESDKQTALKHQKTQETPQPSSLFARWSHYVLLRLSRAQTTQTTLTHLRSVPAEVFSPVV
ncbi:hypothetical protein SRHO_G00257800 [Serrasalmus rhombeus]